MGSTEFDSGAYFIFEFVNCNRGYYGGSGYFGVPGGLCLSARVGELWHKGYLIGSGVQYFSRKLVGWSTEFGSGAYFIFDFVICNKGYYGGRGYFGVPGGIMPLGMSWGFSA